MHYVLTNLLFITLHEQWGFGDFGPQRLAGGAEVDGRLEGPAAESRPGDGTVPGAFWKVLGRDSG